MQIQNETEVKLQLFYYLTLTHLGCNHTEENAKSVTLYSGPRVASDCLIFFACHDVQDEEIPLSPPERVTLPSSPRLRRAREVLT